MAEDLEWTFLDPSDPDPEPAVCRGRDQLAYWMGRGSGWKLRAELEEVVANGERVLVVTRSPGIDAIRARQTGDLNFHVLTVRDGKIVALRACRNRDEALGLVAAAVPGHESGPAHRHRGADALRRGTQPPLTGVTIVI